MPNETVIEWLRDDCRTFRTTPHNEPPLLFTSIANIVIISYALFLRSKSLLHKCWLCDVPVSKLSSKASLRGALAGVEVHA